MGPLGRSLAALAALAAAPVALAVLALRPAWRVGLRERLGGVPSLPPGAVWLHGASVGEALAATRLADALREAGHRVLLSTVTPAGHEMLRRTRPDLACVLAPLDHPFCVARALARVQPALLALVETELWPCWIAGAAERGIPVVVVSGRISDRSLPRYRRLARWLQPSFARLAAVGARAALDAERFASLGVAPERISVTGDLKLEPAARSARPAPDLERALGATPLFVAGSTHDEEVGPALEALAALEAEGVPGALLLAPRYLERADAAAERAQRAGRRVLRRSRLAGETLAPGDVLLLDTLGELAALYGCATLAFVGGSLAPRGGHNLLEPLQAGCPVVFGPHTENARGAAELVLASGAGERVADAAALARAAVAALRDPAASRARGARGRAALEAHRGSVARSVTLIEHALARRPAAAAPRASAGGG